MRRISLLSISALGLLVVGCGVNTDKHTALRLERDDLAAREKRLANEAAQANARAQSYEEQLRILNASGGSTEALLLNKDRQLAELQAQNEQLRTAYNDAVNRMGQAMPLPAQLTSDITNFADANPDLVSFDPATGVLRFKSEVTFASGDAALTSGAAEVIGKFAQILQSAEAKGYEIRIVGHTDDQKVSAATQARGHRDNWQLSSHRAISVAYEFIKQGIDPTRIGVVGHGEYRPVASNATAAGKASNRRVEVMLLPNQYNNTPAPRAEPIAAPAQQPTEVRIERPDMSK